MKKEILLIITFMFVLVAIPFATAPCVGNLNCPDITASNYEGNTAVAQTVCNGQTGICSWTSGSCKNIATGCSVVDYSSCLPIIGCDWPNRCTTGDCCDIPAKTYKTWFEECDGAANTEEKVSCESGHVYVYTRKKLCPGDSASCTTGWEDWEKTTYDNDCGGAGMTCTSYNPFDEPWHVCCNEQTYDSVKNQCINPGCSVSEVCKDTKTITSTFSTCVTQDDVCNPNLHCFPDGSGGVECRCSSEGDFCSEDADCCSGDGTYCKLDIATGIGTCRQPDSCILQDDYINKQSCCKDVFELNGVYYNDWENWVKLTN